MKSVLCQFVILNLVFAHLIFATGKNGSKPAFKHDEHQLRVIILDADLLKLAKQRLETGDSFLNASLICLKEEASLALKAGLFSVMDKPFIPPGGDKHDYMSIGPYWWPNPATPDGLPYIRKDGIVNPERNKYDRIPLKNLDVNVSTLALAYYFTGEERYAEHTAFLIRSWFLDEETRMNPHLKYAQAIPGRTEGRGTGIIDSRAFFRIADAVGLIARSPSWTEQDNDALKRWYEKYLDWLLTSENGKDEAASVNNHGTWYDVIAADLALFVGKKDVACEILQKVPQKRIDVQIGRDGSQQHELSRTRAFHYSAMNLEGLFHLAFLGERVGLDLWNYKKGDVPRLKLALDYLIPFALREKEFPYRMIKGWEDDDTELMIYLLRVASIKYNNAKYENYINRLPDADKFRYRIDLVYPKKY